MKSKHNMLYKILSFTIAIALIGILTNCSDDSDGGSPAVSYVRVTDPTASDSLLAAAGQGQMIAIIGRDLQNTVQLWFNDQPAVLNATFITNTSIITRVPSEIPVEISNQLKLVFDNGESLIYDFTTDVNSPLLSRMKSEYVSPGDVGTIYGDFFYEPIEVTFPGGIVAELVSVEEDEIQFVVPEGAQPGIITVTSPFGATESGFKYMDDRNIIVDFEGPYGGMWKGSNFVVADDPAIPAIDGKFMRVNKLVGAWEFFEVYGGPAESDAGLVTRNIPRDALVNPSAFSLKFELNTLDNLAGATMRLYIGNANNDQLDGERQNAELYYPWLANINTEGEWQTVTIPWTDVYNGFDYNADGYGIFIYFQGPNGLPHNFGLDNMRVVPNTVD